MTTGSITNAFGWVGLTAPNFLGTTSGAWFAVVLLTFRWTFGFNFILYTAAIQDISEEVYEAASIDGAGPWQQIRSITIPLLRPTMSLVLILQDPFAQQPPTRHGRRRAVQPSRRHLPDPVRADLAGPAFWASCRSWLCSWSSSARSPKAWPTPASSRHGRRAAFRVCAPCWARGRA